MNFAVLGLSAKVPEVLMPRLKDEFFVRFRKSFSSCQLPHLKPLRFAQFDSGSDPENGLTAAVSYVNMDWQMFVAVKEKTKAVCFKNLGHGAMLGIMCEVTSKLAAARSPFGTRLVAASIRGAERARPAFARPGHPSQPRSGINK